MFKSEPESEPFKMMSSYAFTLLLIVLAPDIISLYSGYGAKETSILEPERMPGIFALAVLGWPVRGALSPALMKCIRLESITRTYWLNGS